MSTSTPTSNHVWAIPVPYKSLIANLTAYISQKKVICEFARCNDGNPKHTHLPQEIVDLVTARVLAPSFEENDRYWTELEKCAEKECDENDHMPYEEREELALERMYRFYGDNGIKPPRRSELEDQVDAEIEIIHSYNEFGDKQICRERRQEWRDMVTGNDWELRRLGKSEFGLDIVLLVQHVPDVVEPFFDAKGDEAFRSQGKTSSTLGRNPKVSIVDLARLIDQNNPEHELYYRDQAKLLPGQPAPSTLQKHTAAIGAQRYEKPFVSDVSEKNKPLRVEYGKEHENETITGFWLYI